ncbi:hypothetical protein Tco_1218637 [Tanacetum coccineum]
MDSYHMMYPLHPLRIPRFILKVQIIGKKEPKKVSQALAMKRLGLEADARKLLQIQAARDFQVTPKVSHIHAVKRIIEDNFREDVSIFGERLFSGNAKTNIVAISSTKQICSSCKFLLRFFIKSIDFLTGSSINYSLLVDPDLIGPWLQQFWATASLKVINDVPHIRAKLNVLPKQVYLGTCSENIATRDAQGTPTQSAAHSQRTASVQGTAAYQVTCCKQALLQLIKHNIKAAEVLVAISRPRGLSIPGPIQTQPQQPTQGTDPKDKGKGILVEEPKKKKLTLQQIRALETTNDEEVARKIQAEWDAEEERKRFEELKKTKPKTTLRKPTSLAQERLLQILYSQWIQRKKGEVEGKRSKKDSQGKGKQKIAEEQPSKEALKPQSFDSPDGEYLTFTEKIITSGFLIHYGRYRHIENKNTKKGNAMYYPRFTKLIVNFVMAKDPSIPRRNKVNWHYARDDPMFTTINVISRNEDTQLYGAILPTELTNEDIRISESYKEYHAIASGKIPPKTKGSKKKADTDTTTKLKPPTVPKEKKEKTSGKGKQKAKELETIPEAIMTEAEQLKIITKRSRKETHSSHASGSGADEGTGVTPGVPDAPDYDSDDDISWKSSDDNQDDEKAQDDEDEAKNDDNKTTTDDEEMK